MKFIIGNFPIVKDIIKSIRHINKEANKII